MTAPPDQEVAPEVEPQPVGTGSREVWLLAGASGFLGTALSNDLRRRGRTVRRLVRRDPSGPDEVRWDPTSGQLDPAALDGVGVVVNLAGVSIQKRWTDANRKAILDSRVQTTGTLARAIAARTSGDGDLPVFLAQSATGYYAKNRPTPATEADGVRDSGFLGGVCQAWEAAADPARAAGARVCHLRTPVVLDTSGGALPLLAVPFKLGLGVPLGSGAQKMAIVALSDWIAAVGHLADTDAISGPVNLVIPSTVTNQEFTDELARALHRPRIPWVKVPDVALRAALDGFATELVDSLWLVPEALTASGFTFTAPTAAHAIRAALHTGR